MFMGINGLGEQGAPMWGADNSYEHILKDTCLTDDEIRNYVEDLSFSAIHITSLEIFDKPKEISEFKRCQLLWCCVPHDCEKCRHALPLTRAPQSWQWINV